MLADWILSVSAAAFIGGIAAALAPEGKARRLVGFVSGFMTIAVMLAPVARVEVEDYSAPELAGEYGLEDLADYSAYLDAAGIEGYDIYNGELLKKVIEDKTAAYILDKTGINAEVSAVKNSGDYPVPWEVTLFAPYSESVRFLITNDLGIPAERQKWEG
ncbi:MAG: hypothetical protein LBC38_00540 [Oscillospiraceae bacterium]|jgi:hypothetical protein|nr:hypothetical protein [Oscillospiraceae bacterium]